MTQQNEWSIDDKSKELFIKELKQEIAKAYFEELFNEIKPELYSQMDQYIGEHLDGMDVTRDFNTHYEITDAESVGYIQVDVGKIEGEHKQHVRGHRRQGRQVEGHTRTLKDQAIFKDGEKTITSDTIPNNIILKEILAPVLNEYLEDELTEDDFTSSNEPGQEGR